MAYQTFGTGGYQQPTTSRTTAQWNDDFNAQQSAFNSPMGSGSSAYSGWGGTGGTTGSTGTRSGLTGSTGGATPGSNPTGGSTAWNNTSRTTSPWGGGSMLGVNSGAGTTQPTYGTNPVQPNGNPANWNGSSGLPPSPGPNPSTNPGSLADWYNSWTGMQNYPTSPSAQTGQSNVPAGTTPQYGTNPARPGGNGRTVSPVNITNPNSFSWSPPSWVQGQNQAGWGTPEMAQALQNYAQLQPWIQMQQNAMQYGTDFNENSDRFWTTRDDNRSDAAYNQGLSTRQQGMAEWIAQNQQGNWGKQYELDSELGRGNLALGNRQAGIDEMYKQGQLGVAQQQNVIDEMFKRGQLTNEQYANESNRNYQTGQLGIGNRELDLKDWYQREQANLTREGYTNQQQVAAMQAFGRAQRPQARFIRSW
jgi:hypothetical protein